MFVRISVASSACFLGEEESAALSGAAHTTALIVSYSPAEVGGDSTGYRVFGGDSKVRTT